MSANPAREIIIKVTTDIASRLHIGALEYEKDTRTLQKYIQLCREMNEVRLEAQLINLTGLVHFEAGHLHLAKDYMRKAYRIYKAQQFIPELVMGIHNEGVHQYSLGNFSRALKWLMLAYQIAKDSEQAIPWLPYITSNLALTLMGLNRWMQAEQYLQEAEKFIGDDTKQYKPVFIEILMGKAELALAHQDFDQAWAHVRLAQEIAEGMGSVPLLANINLVRAHLSAKDAIAPAPPENYYTFNRALMTQAKSPASLKTWLLQEASYQYHHQQYAVARPLAQEAQHLFTERGLDELADVARMLLKHLA